MQALDYIDTPPCNAAMAKRGRKSQPVPPEVQAGRRFVDDILRRIAENSKIIRVNAPLTKVALRQVGEHLGISLSTIDRWRRHGSFASAGGMLPRLNKRREIEDAAGYPRGTILRLDRFGGGAED